VSESDRGGEGEGEEQQRRVALAASGTLEELGARGETNAAR
jgi:hypothetical protein